MFHSVLKKVLCSLVFCGACGASGQDAMPLGATDEDYQWWREARFGVFVHWGPGALVYRNALSWKQVPGRARFNALGYMADVKDIDVIPPEIYSGAYTNYVKSNGGSIPPRIYNNLYRIFDPVEFDAEEVAQMALDAGAGYVVFTTKHHDGFCMWDSAYTKYDMMSTPSQRDICKELSEACHKRGLRLLWYYSKVDHYDARHDVANPQAYDDYFYNQIEELMTKYGPVEGIWWDGGKIKTDNKRLFDMMNKHHQGVLSNGRVGKIPYGISFGSPEQKLGSFNMDRPWETCAVTHSSSWIWNGGQDIKSPETCLQILIGCAIGDGNLLLNYAPSETGAIDPDIKKIYLAIGEYQKKYGESIKKTRGGPYKPGRWGGSTRRGNTVYLHVTQQWPAGILELPALPAKVLSCSALTGGNPAFEQTDAGLTIKLDSKDHDELDTILVLTLEQDAMGIDPIETIRGHSLTTDARVTASSSINPKSARGGPDVVVHHSFESGKLTKQFGEESDDKMVAINRSTEQKFTEEEMIRIKKMVGNHRGHFWRFWKAKTNDMQPWIEVDLREPKMFRRVGIRELYGDVRGFELQYHDGQDWQTFYTGNVMNTFSLHLANPITAQRIRLQITQNDGDVPQLVEFDLF